MGFTQAGAYRGLQHYPRPLVQDSFIPETLYIVLPDNFGEGDLAALATIASSIGRGTGGDLELKVLRASEATPQQLADSNVVIIGKPQNNAFITELNNAGVLPTNLFGGASLSGVSDNDGVLQLIPSTVNPKYSYLVVTGNSDGGVLKAAQTLSDPPVGISGTTFIAKTETQAIPEPAQEEDFSLRFSELGLTDRAIFGTGGDIGLTFYVPRNWEIQDGANLVINYSSGTNDSATESAMNIYLNGLPIAAAEIDHSTVGEKQLVIPLKQNQILPGSRNAIRIETIITQNGGCSLYNPLFAWMTVRDTSLLYIPYVEFTSEVKLPPIVHPLYYLVNEPTILYSLPAAPGQDVLNAMANLSFILGTGLLDNQAGFEFLVSLNPDMDLSAYGDVSAVIIGKPTDNNAIVKINDALPQPFIAGENSLTPKNFAGRLRTNENVSIGVIQALPAPWNPFKVVTVITGTNDAGLIWALENATNRDAYGAMDGDVVFVREAEVEAFQSAVSFSMPLDTVLTNMTDETVTLEEVQPTVSSPAEEEAPPVITDRYVKEEQAPQTPPTGIIAIAGIIIVGALLAVFGLIRTVRGGRRG